MTIDKQRRIAKDMGRLAAWHGRCHRAPDLNGYPDLMQAWLAGVDEQCAVMSAAAAEIPLMWPDQMESGARGD